MGNKLKWCFKLKGELRIVDINENLTKKYLEEAKSSLQRAQKNFEDKDLLWATVVIYYADYYALYSFLQRLGIKCENHSCSIMAAEFILGKEEIEIINQHQEKRIDAQYYMKLDKEQEVEEMLQESKEFVAKFDELISNLTTEEIKDFRKKIKTIID